MGIVNVMSSYILIPKDLVKVQYTIAETAAYKAVDGIPGFPKYYGT